METRLHLTVSGRVQGVCYRQFVLNQAKALSLRGWVRNLENGDVELVTEGEKQRISQLIDECRKGPSNARVDHLRMDWGKATGEFNGFRVIDS